MKRLRERRIVQIVVSVAAAGWIILEGLNSLIERGILPDFTYRVALVLYLGAIMVSLIAGWYHGEKGHQRVSRPEIIQLALVVVLTVAAASFTSFRALNSVSPMDVSEAGLDLRRVGVMYFQDLTGFGELQYLADGLTESLIERFAGVRTLDVVSRNGAEAFRHTALRPDSVARLLDAGTLVDGSVERSRDGQVRVHFRLIDGASGTEVQRGVLERSAADPTELREDLAGEVSLFLRGWLGEEIQLRRRRSEAESPGTWILVQRGERARKDAAAAASHGDAHEALAQLSLADSLLAEAEAVDPEWVEPTTLRADVAYRRARLLGGTPHEAESAIADAVRLADRALEKSANDARAREVRGTALYFRWLLGLDHAPAERAALLERARGDLETATRMNASLASAYSTLSHLYYQVGDIPNAVLAARSAYEEDAFLDVAHDVLWRLFLGSYDLEQFAQAQRWCREGHERFENSYRFTQCRLWLTATPVTNADVERAWTLLAELERLAPETGRPFLIRQGRMLVGAVLGMDGQLDSARAVLVSARADRHVDPHQELVTTEAFARVMIGDTAAAIELLQRYVAGNPEHTFERGGDLHWWWRPLRDQPGFQAIARP